MTHHSKIILLIALIIPSIQLLPLSVGAPFTSESLFFTIYADGETGVEYTLEVDSNLPRVNIPMFGQLYENMLISSEQDLPLGYTVEDGIITINTLGAENVKILYFTPDLVNKEGAIWSFNVNTTLIFSVRLPLEATIIGLSSIPISLNVADNRYIISLEPGNQTISYSTGVIGTKDQAFIEIKNAEIAVEQAKQEGIPIFEAEQKLEDAQLAFEEERYVEAEDYASKVIQLINQALSQLTYSDSSEEPDILLIPLVGAILSISTIVFVFIMRRRIVTTKYEKDNRVIDTAKILLKKDYLRFEDRDAVKYLAESGGEVFESDLRDHFQLPKTTIWRMVRRLQREDLVKVRKVGGQNLIILKDEESN